MTKSVGPRSARLVIAGLGALTLATCSDDQPVSPDIGRAAEAFSQVSCGDSSLSPNRWFPYFVDPTDVSDRTYNKCHKSWIVDIHTLHPAYTGSGAGGGSDAAIVVNWADTPPANAAACAATGLAAILYEDQPVSQPGGAGGQSSPGTGGAQGFPSGHWVVLAEKHSTPTWIAGGCQNSVAFTGMVAGKTYRVAATARAADDTTRKVGITTMKPLIIH